MGEDRTVDRAADVLRQRILDGTYAIDSRLPAERRLAEELQISRLTLRAAVAHLASEGLLEARQGSGVRVLDRTRTAGVTLLPHLMASGRLELLEPFLTLRRAVAAEAVAEATRRATPARVDALQDRAQALQHLDGPALLEGNLDFSRAIVELADNLPMLLLFNTVAAVVRSRADVQRAMLADPDAVRASFPAIVALIRAGDPERARTLVRQVLEAVDAATLATLEAP